MAAAALPAQHSRTGHLSQRHGPVPVGFLGKLGWDQGMLSSAEGWHPSPLGTGELPHAGSASLGSSAASGTAEQSPSAAVGPQCSTLTAHSKE